MLTLSTGLSATGPLSAIDTSLAAPFTFDRSVVFVCVDVEAFERDHTKVTEVGIATLDTRDLSGVPPGKNGENWRSLIRARHFRIRDHAHLVNSEFVSGCPSSYHFGQSEFISLSDAPAFAASCFQSPFCAEPGRIPTGKESELGEMRNLIVLGHDTLADVKYLKDLGFNALALPNLLEVQDSASIYRVWRRDPQITKLGNILHRFNIDGFGLHNAGKSS